MAAPSRFVPKKAMSFDAKLFEIIGAEETLGIAQHEMTLLPSFPPDSVIHDAACSLGPVTQSIIETSPPDTVKIEATDLAPQMVAIYNSIAAGRKWKSKAVIMAAQKLEFPDSTFTHVFLPFSLSIIEDPVAEAKEIYRTLKPGEARLAIEPNPQHKDRGYIRSRLVEGRFKFEDVQPYQKSAFLPVKDLDEFSTAIWSAIGQPAGGWSAEDDEKWDIAVAKYKELLEKKTGFSKDSDGNVNLEAVV